MASRSVMSPAKARIFRPIARHPGHRRIAHDHEEPGLRPLDGGRLQRLERADRRLLDDVLGVAAVAAEPFGERVGVIEQRRHDLAKAPLSKP